MVDLTDASIKQIQDELKRRETEEHTKKITNFMLEMDCAYHNKKITSIFKDEENKGTSASVTKYHVFVK